MAGDTDTNAAIVGGMLGAYYGKAKLPRDMIDKVLSCDVSLKENHPRPDIC